MYEYVLFSANIIITVVTTTTEYWVEEDVLYSRL